MANTNTHTFKIVLLGDAGVGKTVWLNRARTGEYQNNYRPTLGVEVCPIRFRVRSLYTGEVKTVYMNIWDMAGQEICSYTQR